MVLDFKKRRTRTRKSVLEVSIKESYLERTCVDGTVDEEYSVLNFCRLSSFSSVLIFCVIWVSLIFVFSVLIISLPYVLTLSE